jgi:hypothetical protein
MELKKMARFPNRLVHRDLPWLRSVMKDGSFSLFFEPFYDASDSNAEFKTMLTRFCAGPLDE